MEAICHTIPNKNIAYETLRTIRYEDLPIIIIMTEALSVSKNKHTKRWPILVIYYLTTRLLTLKQIIFSVPLSTL